MSGKYPESQMEISLEKHPRPDRSNRLILYYPVSALVTLFANILQNPNDARARSDVKLMNVVVNFLSTLVSDESNGSIKRMLGLCGEFERIAKVVLDKAERESHTRKKRKSAPDDTNRTRDNQSDGQSSARQRSSGNNPASAAPSTAPMSSPVYANNADKATPNAPKEQGNFASNLSIPPGTTMPADLPSNVNGMPGLEQNFQEMLSPDNLGNVGFPDQQTFAPGGTPMSSFQQPFVPQDLWQMPMTIEWDWADMSSSFPVFDAGLDSNGPPPPPLNDDS